MKHKEKDGGFSSLCRSPILSLLLLLFLVIMFYENMDKILIKKLSVISNKDHCCCIYKVTTLSKVPVSPEDS